MRQLLAASLLLAIGPLGGQAQEFRMEPPKSPAESLRCIKVRPGFTVELMVAEPLVKDPIAFAWGPDGKFWVVEMGDYPLGVDGKGQPGGRIKYLEKTKPDGPYNKMTVFMNNVGYPTGVFPYAKGVLVTCAPDIFYAEVGADGKADKKQILFTGFKEGNQQHRVNGLTWGIDNWIYGANGDSGGVVKSIKTGKEVDIRGRDFRFKVETGEFEAQSGQSQFGRCRDDWGNWFGCNNSNPMFHYVLDDRYLKRNPHVLYPDVRVPVSVKPGAAPVFPISKPLPRFNTPQGLNHFTSACSTIIYRDTLFGKEFAGNMFVSEPVHNLIHREIMKPKGVTFTSQRADDEQTSEFLASSDNWFRPAMIQVGPDGALWIADMYRYVIEHPEWIPKDWQKKLDLRAGHDLGRIYRVYPKDKQPRAMVRMDQMKVEELVRQLESPSGWVRDMAQQLLIREKDSIRTKEIRKMLPQFVAQTKNPQARLHAFYTCREIVDVFDRSTVEEILQDAPPEVRKHLVVYAAYYGLDGRSEKLRKVLADSDPVVQLELAYALGELHQGEDLLANMLCKGGQDPYVSAAILSSISRKNFKAFLDAAVKQPNLPADTFGPLLKLAGVFGEPLDATRLFLSQIDLSQEVTIGKQIGYLARMLESMEKSNASLNEFLKSVTANDPKKIVPYLKTIHAKASEMVANPRSPTDDRVHAIRLLARGLGNDREDHQRLMALLTPQTPDELQAAVIQHLGGNADPRVPALLLTAWRSYSPALRGQVLDTLLSRPTETSMIVDALQKKQIPISEIDAIRRQRLLAHKDASIRTSAETIFASATNADRVRVFNDYWLRLPYKTDSKRGAMLFQKACAACHRLGDAGQHVGPDLASVGDKSVNGLLTAILDPNRAVEARYINYVATTRKGLTFTGILMAETSTTITLVGPDGKQHPLLRNELDELASTGMSMMPEGLEKDLSPQDLADIIAHVRGVAPASPKPGADAGRKRKLFPGNEPMLARPDANGIFVLVPTTAAVFGPSIVIEKKYGNFGYWSSLDDHVVWTVSVPKAGAYDVWIYYACADDSAGNTLRIASGDERLRHKVETTGSWDQYRGERIGELRLAAGVRELVLRPDGPIRGALIDLKKVELVPR